MAHKHGAQAGSIGAEVIRFYSLLDTRSMGNCLWNSEGLSGSVSEIIMCKKAVMSFTSQLRFQWPVQRRATHPNYEHLLCFIPGFSAHTVFPETTAILTMALQQINLKAAWGYLSELQ